MFPTGNKISLREVFPNPNREKTGFRGGREGEKWVKNPNLLIFFAADGQIINIEIHSLLKTRKTHKVYPQPVENDFEKPKKPNLPPNERSGKLRRNRKREKLRGKPPWKKTRLIDTKVQKY